MSRSGHVISLAGVGIVVLSSLALAACGGGGETAAQSPVYGGSGSAAGQQSASQTTSGTVSTASTSLGTILVDSQGWTLYLFKPDRGTNSACSAACCCHRVPRRLPDGERHRSSEDPHELTITRVGRHTSHITKSKETEMKTVVIGPTGLIGYTLVAAITEVSHA